MAELVGEELSTGKRGKVALVEAVAGKYALAVVAIEGGLDPHYDDVEPKRMTAVTADLDILDELGQTEVNKIIIQLRAPGSILLKINGKPTLIAEGWELFYETPLVLNAKVTQLSCVRGGTTDIDFQVLAFY